jgi:hypothetical protein
MRWTPYAAAAVLLSLVAACLPQSSWTAERSGRSPAGTDSAAGVAAPQRQDSPESSDDSLSAAMLSVQEAGVLRAGLFEVAFLLDNYDRDPLGIDVMDGVVAFRLGVARGLELDLGYQITRSVSVPGAHPVPPPPLDLVVASGDPPAGAYRAMYWPMPYLKHYPARVGDMVPGAFTLGIKGRLFRQQGFRPALALGLEVTTAGDTPRYELSKGSGSGSVDAAFRAAASWRYRRLRLSANLGATLNGTAGPGDRFIIVSDRRVEDMTIRRPYFLHSGLGLGFRVWRGLSLLAEASGWAPVGGHTRMQSECGASDVLGGLELRLRGLTLGLGVRQHLSPQQDRMSLATGPLAGAVDLSDASEAAQNASLALIGAHDHRPGANLVVLGWPEDLALPDGARRIPDQYATHTTGNAGFIVRLAIRLGH